MNGLSSPVVLVVFCLVLANGQEFDQKMFQALATNPLMKNPFFLKMIALSGQFDGKGEEELSPDFSGYVCQWFGPLDCDDDYQFTCSGKGIIDCTGTCPGDEETIQAMLDMLENKTITSQLPMMNSMNKGGKNDSKENDESAKAKKETLMTILKGCKFEKLLALMSLADTGLTQNDNSSLTHVDESAVAGFDYYDYYDDEEEEVSSTPPNATKDDYLSEEEEEEATEETPEDENDIFSPASTPTTTVDASEEENNIFPRAPTPAANGQALPVVQRREERTKRDLSHKTPRSVARRRLRALNREVSLLRDAMTAALDAVDRAYTVRNKRSVEEEVIQEIAEDLAKMDQHKRRRMRSVLTNMEGIEEPVEEKCVVRNLTCVEFPIVKKCRGIALGGCISRVDLLKAIFSSKTVIITIVTVVFLIIFATGGGYYIYKKNQLNRVDTEAESKSDPGAAKPAAQAPLPR